MHRRNFATHYLDDLHVGQTLLKGRPGLNNFHVQNGDQGGGGHFAQRLQNSLDSLGPVHNSNHQRLIQ